MADPGSVSYLFSRKGIVVVPQEGTDEDTVMEAVLEAGAEEVTAEGDVFEMEDQRNWTDGSFKTYVRPLALPWPYRLADGEVLRQSVTVSWTGAGRPARAAGPEIPAGTVFPQMALVLTPEEARNPAAAATLGLVR